MKEKVLALLLADKLTILDLLRLKVFFKEYMREVAERMGIDTKKGYWSVSLAEKSPLVKGVWASLDLVREYVEISGDKEVSIKDLLNKEEVDMINDFVSKLQANEEPAKRTPTFDEVLSD